MKHIALLFFLIIPTILVGKDVRFVESKYSVKTNLKDQLIWKLDGATWKFSQNGNTCELKNEKGKLIYTWNGSLEVVGAMVSEKGTAMLVLVMTAKGFYHGLTRFVLANGTWKIDEVMLGDHPDMEIRDRWIRELGAVADDGGTAIFHIGEADSDRTPKRQGFRMFYSWQTWELNKTKRLGVGLKMSNAKKG